MAFNINVYGTAHSVDVVSRAVNMGRDRHFGVGLSTNAVGLSNGGRNGN
jgi:hypothetical protein